MKRFTALALFAIASFAMAGMLYAQERTVMATVPFGFTVGDRLYPAGTYLIHSESSNLLTIRNQDKPITAFVIARPETRESKNGAKLLFHKYDDQYFLSEILCSSAGMNLALYPSRLEKRIQVQQAWIHSNNEVFIAAR